MALNHGIDIFQFKRFFVNKEGVVSIFSKRIYKFVGCRSLKNCVPCSTLQLIKGKNTGRG